MKKKKMICGSLQTILLCLVGELAKGGSVSVAVGVSDMWQVRGDTWHMYWCYFPHTLKDSVSPLSGCFLVKLKGQTYFFFFFLVVLTVPSDSKILCFPLCFHLSVSIVELGFNLSQYFLTATINKIAFWGLWYLVRWDRWDARRQMFPTIPPSPPHRTSNGLFLTYDCLRT